MEQPKKSVKLWADGTQEGIELKESLLEKGLNVNHILTASSLPILKDNKNYISGIGNIKVTYEL